MNHQRSTEQLVKIIRYVNRKAWAFNNVSFYGANLRNANLSCVDLHNSNMRETDLRGAKLYRANLRNVDFRGADFFNANLLEASLVGTNLIGAKSIISIYVPEMSSRGDYLYAIQHSNCIMIKAGCFWTDIEEFKKMIIQKKEANSLYMDVIEFIEKSAKRLGW